MTNPHTFHVTDALGRPYFPHPCELHSQSDCAICRRVAGQCSYGTCQEDAVWRRVYTHKRTGHTYEVRAVCKLHNERLDECDPGRADLSSVEPINV
jgi:hypothetical protein